MLMHEIIELEKLCDLLDAQLEGRPVDSAEVGRLAKKLQPGFPAISRSLGQIAERVILPSLR